MIDDLGLRPIGDFFKSGTVQGLPKVEYGDHRVEVSVDQDVATWRAVVAVSCRGCRSSVVRHVRMHSPASSVMDELKVLIQEFKMLPDTCRETKDVQAVRDVMDS